MLRRKIYNYLLQWKDEQNKPCLLIQGARQVGKSTTIEQFCQENYDDYIMIDFELQPELRQIFDGNLDITTLKSKLSLYFRDKNLNEGKFALFLDEIQVCPNARTALKTFAIDGSIDVICSGSLLGLYYKEVSSYPVGYERIVDMFSLDFEEFLWANNVDATIIEVARESFINKKPLDDFYIKILSDLFKHYTIVGGMPKVVMKYINTKDFNIVLQEQQATINSYIIDILKYAPESMKQKIINTYNSIPSQLGKKNKKFMYTKVDDEKDVGSRKYASALYWLVDAGLVNQAFNLTEPALPLMSNIITNSFKVYMRDTGLLMSMYEAGTAQAIINDDYQINEGAIIENICAQEIFSRYKHLFYFEKKSKIELDFIINKEGLVYAIETKSGKKVASPSLNRCRQEYQTISKAMKFELNTNVVIDDKGIEHYPLFMMMFI